MTRPVTATLTFLCTSLIACGIPEDPRAAWLVEQITRDNRVWWTRDPEVLAAKYRTMAADPYDYMRGTAGVFLRDLERPGTDRLPTAFLSTAKAADILLVVDPHPENVGGFLPGWPPPPDDGGFRLDFNDFDAAAHGPWIWDLRRGAAGLSVLLEPIADCDPTTCRDAAVERFAREYARAILDPASAPPVDDLGAWGEVVDRLVDDLIDKGRTRDEVGDQTERGEDGSLVLVREPIDDDGDGLLDLTDDERRQVDRLVEAFLPHAPDGFRLRDVVRRFGRGVSSQPAFRYYWLWDQGDPGDDDDRLFQVREVVDPPAVPNLAAPVPGLFGGQADRVRAAADALWAVPGSDPLMTGLQDGTMTFKVLSLSGYSDGFDHGDIAKDADKGKTGPEDLIALGGFVGHLLGGAHARGPTASGHDARDAIREDLDGRVDVLVDELVASARADLQRTLDDHARFVDALDRLGPWLGADRVYVDQELTP